MFGACQKIIPEVTSGQGGRRGKRKWRNREKGRVEVYDGEPAERKSKNRGTQIISRLLAWKRGGRISGIHRSGGDGGGDNGGSVRRNVSRLPTGRCPSPHRLSNGNIEYHQ